MRAALQSVRDWVDAGGRLLKSRAGRRETDRPARWPAIDHIVDEFPSPFPRAPRSAVRARGMAPWYRNASELAEAIASCEAALGIVTEPVIEIVHVADAVHAGRRPALPADESARQFVGWLRQRGECDPLGDRDICRLYAEHCAESDVEEVPQNILREALKHVPGVFKKQFDRRGENGRRVRPFMWEILPTASKPLRAHQMQIAA